MWCFRKKSSGEKIRNPIQGEFFATDAIAGPAQALVRESFQNSLDARLGEQPVRIRLRLADASEALPASSVKALFADAIPHFRAEGNGLRDAPSPDAPCPYLVVEDFGTTGLTGDPTEADPPEIGARKNAFYLFFRAEGLSEKSGTRLGRWGVGKFVFPRSSRASTHFGLTVRHDDGRCLLLGAVTLKAHRVPNEDGIFTPDGMYGSQRADGLVLPMESETALAEFRRTFHLSRLNEPGLSVVIPWVDPDISFNSLLTATINDYFFPILNRRLIVEIRAGGLTARLDHSTLDHSLEKWKSVIGDRPAATVSLARFVSRVTDAERIVLADQNMAQAPKWSDALVSPEQLELIKTKLAEGEGISVRVPVNVRLKSHPDQRSHFDIYLKPDAAADGRPVFIRQGIIISDLKAKRARELRSLVIIEDEPIAALLGDSENPAHTQWQKDSSNFRGKYTFGPSVIDFVTQSVSELVGIINRSSSEQDTSLTVSFFSLPTPQPEPTPKPGPTPQPSPTPMPDPPPHIPEPGKNPRLQIQRTVGGFSVRPIDHERFPMRLHVQCAYLVESGHPLKKWNAADFTLQTAPVRIALEGGGTLGDVRGNELWAQIDREDFALNVDGFDTNRDIYVRAIVEEAGNGDSQA